MLKEFKKFIARGNVIDLAVGVILGTAFASIIASIVNDILMPVFGIILGGINFTSLTLKVGEASIKYGNFIQSIINFLIISICIFLIIKLINKLTNKKEEVIKKNENTALLEEIRDLLKK